MDNTRRRGRPLNEARVADPLVPIDIPISIREKLFILKRIRGTTYGGVIEALLVDSNPDNEGGGNRGTNSC